VIEAQRRHLAPAELATGKKSPMTGDDVALTIDQDRNIEPERLDAGGDLPDLLLAVKPRVRGVRL
jgi:hypothetical protein